MKRLSIPLIACLAASDGMAAELVLYGSQETEDTARAKVALFGGRTLASLQAETLTSLYSGDAPVVVGGATLTECDGDASTNASIQEIVAATESTVLFMEFETAKESLDRAVALERCLAEPIDAQIASRVHYLRAMVAVGSGDQASAWPEFVQAAILKSDITWDENFPPDGRTAFKGAVAAMKVAETQDFHLVPPPAQSLWIDGAKQENTGTLALRPGLHVLQLGNEGEALSTYGIDLPEATRAALLFPSQLEDDRVDWAASGETRVQLEAVLAANSQGSIAYVALPGQVLWQFDPGTWEWTPLSGVSDEEAAAIADAGGQDTEDSTEDAAPESPQVAADPKLSTGLTSGLRYGGAGLAVAGGSLAGLGFKKMTDAAALDPGDGSATSGEISNIDSLHSQGKSLYLAGIALSGVGAAGAASSFFLDSPTGPRLTAFPGGVILQGRW